MGDGEDISIIKRLHVPSYAYSRKPSLKMLEEFSADCPATLCKFGEIYRWGRYTQIQIHIKVVVSEAFHPPQTTKQPNNHAG